MRILQVIHGYPMRFNAGSEVYTQTLAHALARRYEVRVFTRFEDPFQPDGAELSEDDPLDPRVRLHLVNVPNDRDRYRRPAVDAAFGRLLDDFRPHVVHLGHLNHLSTTLVREAHLRDIPVVFTLHDFWLMCPRGQFIQMHPENPADLWSACPGQEDGHCAARCYARYFSGAPDETAQDLTCWTDWVRRRMAHVREMVSLVDRFIAPSRSLAQRFHSDFGLPRDRTVFLDYGFDRSRLTSRVRVPEPDFVFGYIGTHIPAKGIHHLLDAFARVPGRPRLRLWGRARPGTSDALRALVERLPQHVAARVDWRPEYENRHIVRDVLNHVDAIVVPSIWPENSPLVIHEAQGARLPVITANSGGMAEYVRDGVNGALYAFRDPEALARAMTSLAVDPDAARRLGQRGYLFSETGEVPDIAEHADAVVGLYSQVLRARRTRRAPARPGPWRITFDTNPDDCNLKCLMCEEHSPLSQKARLRDAGLSVRRRMPIALARRVVEDLRGTPLREVIPSTMGEPLLFEGMDELIDLCAEEGLFVNLTTNGTFPRRGARGWARRLLPVLSDVKVSWNGVSAATQEGIMLGSRLSRMEDALSVFIAERDAYAAAFGHRARVTLQLTFLESNLGELPELIRFAGRLGVDRVKGHHLWAHFREIEPLSLRRSPDAIARWNATVGLMRAAASEVQATRGRPLLLENVVELPIPPVSEHGGPAAESPEPVPEGAVCPFLGQEAWVSAQGRFDPCCAPDELRRTLGDFGDLHQVTLSEIWQGPRYQQLQATYLDHPLCRGCTMRKVVGRG